MHYQNIKLQIIIVSEKIKAVFKKKNVYFYFFNFAYILLIIIKINIISKVIIYDLLIDRNLRE